MNVAPGVDDLKNPSVTRNWDDQFNCRICFGDRASHPVIDKRYGLPLAITDQHFLCAVHPLDGCCLLHEQHGADELWYIHHLGHYEQGEARCVSKGFGALTLLQKALLDRNKISLVFSSPGTGLTSETPLVTYEHCRGSSRSVRTNSSWREMLTLGMLSSLTHRSTIPPCRHPVWTR